MLTLGTIDLALALANDDASWRGINRYPAMPVVAAMLHAADCAAADPEWWHVTRWLIESPAVDFDGIACLNDATAADVARIAARHPLAVSDPLPADAFDPCPPEAADLYNLTPRSAEPGVTGRNTVTLCDWASCHPEHWRCLRLAYRDTAAPLRAIAEALNISITQAAAWSVPPQLATQEDNNGLSGVSGSRRAGEVRPAATLAGLHGSS
ncbi:MAG: hypothetical protein PHI85_03920 [Victivallaceae bacterium]|nr:hypothetical protein [Victivallaceae bacterium]